MNNHTQDEDDRDQGADVRDSGRDSSRDLDRNDRSDRPAKEYFDENNVSRRAVGRLFSDSDPKRVAEASDPDRDNTIVKGFSDTGIIDQDASAMVARRIERSLDAAHRTDGHRTDGHRTDGNRTDGHRDAPSNRGDASGRADMPQPKPAVKINPHLNARQPIRTPQSGMRRPPQSNDEDPSVEYEGEEFNSFKKRYSGREYIPTGKSKHDDRFDDDYGGGSNAVRIIVAVICAIFIFILIFLAYQLNSVSNKLKTAQTALSKAPNVEDFNNYKMDNESMQQQIIDLENQIKKLQEAPPTPVPTDEPNETDLTGGDGNTTTTITGDSETYEIVSGDNLTKIANKFYGNSSKDNIDKILAANNLKPDAIIRIGQKLVIPK